MKTVQQWMDEWEATLGMSFEEILEEAQKDAYNQALEDASEYASVEYKRDILTGEVDKDSILKLKK